MTFAELLNVIRGLPPSAVVMVRDSAGNMAEALSVELQEKTCEIPRACWLEIRIDADAPQYPQPGESHD